MVAVISVALISVPGGESYDHPLNTGSYQIQIEASRIHESQYRLLLYIHVLYSCPEEVASRVLLTVHVSGAN
jgi:hypothetical protein